jgi:hypothetical protein
MAKKKKHVAKTASQVLHGGSERINCIQRAQPSRKVPIEAMRGVIDPDPATGTHQAQQARQAKQRERVTRQGLAHQRKHGKRYSQSGQGLEPEVHRVDPEFSS